MSAGVLNALNYYGQMQRNQNTLNSIQNPAVVNPMQAMTNAMQTAAMIKYLRGGNQAQLPKTALSGSIDLFGNSASPNANALNAGAAGASAAPATASSGTAATPAAASSSSASPPVGWFMPKTNAANQGNSVYVGPQGQHYLDTSPPTLPYSGWQQPSGSGSPTSSSGSSLGGALNTILNDPSDAGIHTAMTSLYPSYGRAADLARNDLLSMSVDQRRSFAQQQLASMNAATAGTTTATS